MIDSIFREMEPIEEETQAVKRLREIGYYEMFEGLMIMDDWFKVFRYILFAYSFKSDLLDLTQSWQDCKRKIADIYLPKDAWHQLNELERVQVFDGVVTLRIPEVVRVIDEYLTWQGNEDFRHLVSLREGYERFISSPFKIDMSDDQVFSNLNYAQKLKDAITEYKTRVRQQMNSNVEEGKKEVDQKMSTIKQRKPGLSLESKL